MNIIQTSKELLNILYTCANVPLGMRSLALRKRCSKEIRINRSLKTRYSGKRCFVIGNGPSFNKVDINKLVGENLITVNRLYLHPYYESLNPIFHCAIDPGMYKGDAGNEFLEVIKRHQDTSFLLSSNAPNEFKVLSNCFVKVLGFLPSSLCSPYDLAKPSAAFINVILVAIELAIYLGFETIILLGCDFNQFAVRKESHSYKENDSGERMATLFQDLQGHAIALMQHEWLFKYAQKKNVSIVNATEGSYLDIYPRIDINSVI